MKKPNIYWQRKYLMSAGFIVLFAVIGVVILFASHAATPYTSIEAESGTLATATKVTDAKASSGSYVQFGNESTGGGTGGGGSSPSGGCATSAGVLAPCIGSATTAASGWGAPVFDDEFTESSLNNSWNNTWYGGSQNNADTSAANVSISGGDLILTLSSATVGASVNTDPLGGAQGFLVGDGDYVEGRVQFAGSGSTIYNWPAFWVTAQNGRWPEDGEIDIAEGYNGVLTSNYHSSAGANNGPNEPGSWGGSMHIYGVDREAGVNYIYWDGQLIRTYSTDDNGAPEIIVINVGAGNTQALDTASQIKVDYVRVWKH